MGNGKRSFKDYVIIMCFSVSRMTKQINRRMYNFLFYIDWIYRKTHHFQLEKKAFDTYNKLSQQILELRKCDREKIRKTASYSESVKKPFTYIEQIFRMAEEIDVLDEQWVINEVDTIIFGGSETSALTLSNMLLMLAMHEDIQQKVYQEIVDVIGESDPFIPVKVEHITQLNYTEMVIKETMRLFPLGLFIGRSTTAPVKICNDVKSTKIKQTEQIPKFFSANTTIPPGATIACDIFTVHRNPKYWGDRADDFDPDRFFPEHVAERHPYSYLPFSGGPRNCIGYKYGLMSMKIMLCYLLRSYKFKSPLKMEQLQLKMSITLKIANRHMVQIERRNY